MTTKEKAKQIYKRNIEGVDVSLTDLYNLIQESKKEVFDDVIKNNLIEHSIYAQDKFRELKQKHITKEKKNE